jgi:hypothetical protein
LERALASDLNGTVKLDFRENGLICRIAFPVDRQAAVLREDAVAEIGAQSVDTWQVAELAPTRTTHGDQRSGARVLVVEDESLLALEVEHALNSAGSSVIGRSAISPRRCKPHGAKRSTLRFWT